MKTPPAILGKIAESTLTRVAKAKEVLPLEQIQEQLHKENKPQSNTELWVKSDNPAQTPYPANQDNNKGYYNIGIPQNTLCNSVVKNILPFESALSASGLSFICEVKKASPSKGIISEDFPWLEIAKEYEIGGAAAISVLTEPEFFLGSGLYLQEISKAVKIPTLRKDFIIDPYQIYEAKLWGAQAILLICALLEPETISSFIAIADELELDCLVEVHNEDETREAIEAGSRIIGINNRDLTNFKVDTGLTARLMKNIPAGILTVAESGINKTDDIRELIGIGVDAVLIGESLMRSADKKKFLSELRAVPAQQ